VPSGRTHSRYQLRWLHRLPLAVSRHAAVSTVPRFQGQGRPPGQAEHAAQSLAKGSRVVVMGRLQQRSWTAEDGSARSVVEVVRDHLEEIRDETGYSVPAGVADEIASLVERLR
jgi:hypothetical protein